MKNDPVTALMTTNMINDHLMEKCKENAKLINILKTGKQFTDEDVEMLKQLPIYNER